MTKEEFYKLTETRPDMHEESIYELTIYSYDRNATGYTKNEDGEWRLEIEEHPSLYFTGLDKAEEALEDAPEQLTVFRRLHSAIIRRIPLNTAYRQMPIAWWLYDNNGKIVDHSVCSSFHAFDKHTHAGKFLGRRENEIRFKKGDFAEEKSLDPVTDRLIVKLVKIIHTPNTIDEEWAAFNDCQNSMGLYPFDGLYVSDYFDDASADSYIGLGCDKFVDEMMAQDFTALTFPAPQEAIDAINLNDMRLQELNRCTRKYHLSACEAEMILNGEITEEDIRLTRKMSEHIKQNPGKTLHFPNKTNTSVYKTGSEGETDEETTHH